jgi:hypothetical protein
MMGERLKDVLGEAKDGREIVQQISGLVEERMEDCLLMGEGWLINGLGVINGLLEDG